MADLTFRSNDTAGNSSLTVNNINTGLPAGTQSGDLMTIWCAAGVLAPASPPSIATPAGWTLAGSSNVITLSSGVVNVKAFLFYRVAGGGEGTVNLATVGGTNAILIYSRSSRQFPAASNVVPQVSWITATGGPGTSAVVSGLTTGADRALIEACIIQGVAQGATPPGSMSERSDLTANGISTADELIPLAGATGTRTFTLPVSADFIWGIAEFRSLVYAEVNDSLRRSPPETVKPQPLANPFDVAGWAPTVATVNRWFLRDWWITAPAGSGAYTLTAAQGSYSLTGQSAALRAARTIAAAQGTYSLTGQAVGLLAARKVVAAQGSYSLTGQAAGLTATRNVTAAQGTYTITGQAAGLLKGQTLAADQGAYTLTGQAAGLIATRSLLAGAGSYALTGQDVTLLYGSSAKSIAAEQGFYTLTGQDAALTYTPTTPEPDLAFPDAVGPVRKKSHRKEVEEDVQSAIAELTHVAKAADDIAQAPVDAVAVHFQPTQARINEALGEAAQLVREALSAIQRTRLQMAMERAREAEQAMQLRMEMQERARLEAEAAVRKARRRRAAAFVAAYMFGEED